jgi:hypothetical protein
MVLFENQRSSLIGDEAVLNIVQKNKKIKKYPFKGVPKHENFSIWVCDVGTAKKIEFFYGLTPDFDGFLPHTECAVNRKNI